MYLSVLEIWKYWYCYYCSRTQIKQHSSKFKLEVEGRLYCYYCIRTQIKQHKARYEKEMKKFSKLLSNSNQTEKDIEIYLL